MFGFSSYVVERGGLGQLNMTAVFLLPLIALVVLRFHNDELTGIGVVLRLGPLIAFQLLLSTEIAFTLTLALVAALTFCVAFDSGEATPGLGPSCRSSSAGTRWRRC